MGGGTMDEPAAGLTTEGAGADGFASLMLAADTLPAVGCSVLGAAGRAGTGADAPSAAAGARVSAGAACGTGPIRSPGKRMPQNPTAGSVNSNSTYPLALR